jgi:endonuclease/exonuclease/phosphatase family metal-dependent hydrolase
MYHNTQSNENFIFACFIVYIEHVDIFNTHLSVSNDSEYRVLQFLTNKKNLYSETVRKNALVLLTTC